MVRISVTICCSSSSISVAPAARRTAANRPSRASRSSSTSSIARWASDIGTRRPYCCYCSLLRVNPDAHFVSKYNGLSTEGTEDRLNGCYARIVGVCVYAMPVPGRPRRPLAALFFAVLEMVASPIETARTEANELNLVRTVPFCAPPAKVVGRAVRGWGGIGQARLVIAHARSRVGRKLLTNTDKIPRGYVTFSQASSAAPTA